MKKKNAKKYRRGYEYGSARWGTEKDIENFMDSEKSDNNIILTQTERLMMNSRPKSPKYARNKNVLVTGGSGSGKTRFFLIPNLLQMHSSYVVTDPKGDVVINTGKTLLHHVDQHGAFGCLVVFLIAEELLCFYALFLKSGCFFLELVLDLLGYGFAIY